MRYFWGYFLLFTLTYTQKCSWNNSIDYEQIYLCREKVNSTSIRIWLQFKFNHQWNFFSYYVFTLRIIDEDKIQLKDRFEKQISDYTKIDLNQKENHTIDIHHLSSGHYEICVNFFNNKTDKFYYRSSNSCLYIPWNVLEQPNLSIHVLFMILIIILLITCAFFIYAIHEYFKSRKRIVLSQVEDDHDINECARFLVNQHFVEDINPFVLSVRKRIHQRYAHRI